jgi:hypothetical protein
MQKKSLLSTAQETAAAPGPEARAPELLLPVAATGDGGLDRLLGGCLPVAAPYESAGAAPPYLFFYYGIGDGAEGAKKALPNVRKGDLVLVAHGEYSIVRPPVRLFLRTAHQHWAERLPTTQQLLKATLTPQGRGSPLREEVESLVLLQAGDGLVPATWRTKGGACRGPVLALKELAAADKPEWLAQSEAHKLTAELEQPWVRFVAEIDYGLETSRGGNEYVVTGAVCQPVGPDALARLRDFLANPESLRLFGEALAEHERKVGEIMAKAKLEA